MSVLLQNGNLNVSPFVSRICPIQVLQYLSHMHGFYYAREQRVSNTITHKHHPFLIPTILLDSTSFHTQYFSWLLLPPHKSKDLQKLAAAPEWMVALLVPLTAYGNPCIHLTSVVDSILYDGCFRHGCIKPSNVCTISWLHLVKSWYKQVKFS